MTTPNPRRTLNWAPIFRRWSFDAEKITYLGPDQPEPDQPIGICVANAQLSEGQISCRVKLTEPAQEARTLPDSMPVVLSEKNTTLPLRATTCNGSLFAVGVAHSVNVRDCACRGKAPRVNVIATINIWISLALRRSFVVTVRYSFRGFYK